MFQNGIFECLRRGTNHRTIRWNRLAVACGLLRWLFQEAVNISVQLMWWDDQWNGDDVKGKDCGLFQSFIPLWHCADFTSRHTHRSMNKCTWIASWLVIILYLFFYAFLALFLNFRPHSTFFLCVLIPTKSSYLTLSLSQLRPQNMRQFSLGIAEVRKDLVLL
jgi:hypothetical protein